jgi:hypothetical protein
MGTNLVALNKFAPMEAACTVELAHLTEEGANVHLDGKATVVSRTLTNVQ